MAASIDALIQEAASALKAGRKADARRALDQAIALDERSEQAWLWMSGVVDNDEEQEICLENVLAINPSNQKAQKGLDTLRAKRSAGAVNPAVPFVGAETTNSKPPPTPGATGGVGGTDWGDWSSWPSTETQTPPPTSVEWGSPTPPAKTDFPSQPSTEEYDSWMAGLPLGKGNAMSSAGSVPAFDLSSDFDNAPFSSPGFESGSFSSPSYNPLADVGRSPSSDSFTGPFDDAASALVPESDPFGLGKRPSPTPPAPSTTDSGQNSFSFKRKIGTPPALAAARKQSDATGTFDDYASDDSITFTATQSSASPIPQLSPSNTALFTTMDNSTAIASPSAYFSGIPEEIRASSVASPFLFVTLIVLAILNVGSLVWLVGNLRVH